MTPTPKSPPAAGRQLLRALLSLAHTRLEIFGIEVAEEKARMLGVLFSALASMLFATLALITATVLIAVLCWDSYRWQALTALTVLYAVVAAVLAFWARRALSTAPEMFETTLAEFRKDSELF